MKESLIGSVVNTVTGTVESTTNALTGSTPTATSSDDSVSPTRSPSTTTSAPASTTSTPKTATPTPTTITSAPASTTPTPTSTTSAPTATAAPIMDSSTSVSDTVSSASSSSSSSISESTISPTATPTETAPPSSTSVLPSAAENYRSTSMSMSDSGSSSIQIGGSHSYVSISIGSQTGSSSQGDGEAGVTDVSSTGLSAASIVGLALGALGTLLLLGLLVSWCLRRRRRQLMSSISHVRLGSTGNLPLFNTRGTERFETSSTSVPFGPFHTARLNSDHDSTSGRSGLWEDEVITAMRIPLEKLTTTKLLSSGGYGEVYRGVYREEIVAIKVLLPEKQKDLEQINVFLAEIKMMATIDHPCVVRFFGVAWDSLSDLSAVMEFMEGGDLRALLDRFQQENRPRGFNLDKARIALQTAQALTYLYSLDPTVLHRDFKSRNILLTSELDAKLSDFGVARKYNFTSMTAAVGTSLWMAPEVMLGDRYDASADIFSFGVVLYELDSHLYPCAEARMTNSGQRVPDAAVLQLVAMGRVSVNFSSNAPTELIDLGRACVSLNPMARPSASEVHYRLQLILQAYEMYTV